MIPIDKLEETSSPLITQFELMVLLDCLHGSLQLADGANIWRWTTNQRKTVLEAIYQRMANMPIDTPTTKP
jgi:hypothetical protein